MDQSIHTPEVYDFRQYDRIWQRVAPNLEPYPGMGQAAAATSVTAPASAVPVASQPPVPVVPAAPGTSAAQTRQEGQLPGAAPNPCCMGSAAMEMLEVLTGYIETSLSDRRAILALVRQAPSWARQRLRDISADLTVHARRLMAAYYLITGSCYRPSVGGTQAVCPGGAGTGRWCAALRERYHAAACSGMNYARSADDTTDPCLAKLLNGLSADAYRHAEELMRLLERGLQG